MRTFLLCALCASMIGGCTILEKAGKAGASIVLDTLEEKIPGMTATMANSIEKTVYEKIEKVVEAGREKIVEKVGSEMARYREVNGINLADYDANDNGTFEAFEIRAAYGAIQEENDRRKREGEDPVPWTEYVRLAAIFAGVYAGGSLGKGGIRKLMNGKTAPKK